jgi:hypothetical protein
MKHRLFYLKSATLFTWYETGIVINMPIKQSLLSFCVFLLCSGYPLSMHSIIGFYNPTQTILYWLSIEHSIIGFYNPTQTI